MGRDKARPWKKAEAEAKAPRLLLRLQGSG
jgi:hypothetical protein